MFVDLRIEKIFGFFGLILILLGGLGDGVIKIWLVVVFLNLVLFIGFIFVFLVFYGISIKFNDDRLFRYYFYFMVVIIIGMVLVLVFFVVGVFFVFNLMIVFRNIYNYLGIFGLIMVIFGVFLIFLVVILVVYF